MARCRECGDPVFAAIHTECREIRRRIEAETVAKIVEMLRSEARALRAAKAKSFEDAARVTLVAFADRLEREWKRGT